MRSSSDESLENPETFQWGNIEKDGSLNICVEVYGGRDDP